MSAGEILDAAGVVREGAGRAEVWASNRNPVDIADEVVAVILATNEPPRLFRMGETAVRLRDDGTLEPYDADRWLLHTARRVNFLTPVKDGEPRRREPPAAALKMVPPAALPYLPELAGVVATPYLTAAGELVAQNGYHPGSRLVLHCGDLALPAVPDAPTRRELRAAVRLLTDEWLADFPFASDSGRANAIALLLTLTGRAFFGLAPMTVIDASTAGSGKGLLLATISIIATGQPPNLLELPAEGEEQRKKITSALLAGNDLIAWDEAHVIAGRTLALILTAETYSDRLLGSNKLFSVANRFTQVALGNNVQVWGDLKRRIVPSRLEPDHEHPEHRTDFRHPNLLAWVRENRGELLAAVLTIWRAWIAAGSPRADIAMGSYEKWAAVIGGALANAGIPGFMDATDEWIDQSEGDDGGWPAHLEAIYLHYGEDKFTAKDIADLVDIRRVPLPYEVKREDGKSLAFVLGNMWRGVRSRWISGYRLEASRTKDSASGGRTWRVLSREGSGPGLGLSGVSELSESQSSGGEHNERRRTTLRPVSGLSVVSGPQVDKLRLGLTVETSDSPDTPIPGIEPHSNGGQPSGAPPCTRCGKPATRRAAGKPSCAGCAPSLMGQR